MVVLLVLSFVLLALTLDYFVQRATARRIVRSLAAARPTATPQGLAAGLADRQLPAGLFLSPGHVWLRREEDGAVLVGADRLLLDLLGGVDRVYTLDEGAEVHSGGPLFMLRRGSRALKVRSPVAGRVARINALVRESSAGLAEDPLRAWVYRIEPQGLDESLRRTATGGEAAAFLGRELGRLRDLTLELAAPPLAGRPVLADGGEPLGDLASRIGDREWEELVIRFFGAAETGDGTVLPFPQRDLGD